MHHLYMYIKAIHYFTRYYIFAGFNPKWGQTLKFRITNSELALIRFSVYDSDAISSDDFIGQNTIPVPSIGEGKINISNKIIYEQFMSNL